MSTRLSFAFASRQSTVSRIQDLSRGCLLQIVDIGAADGAPADLADLWSKSHVFTAEARPDANSSVGRLTTVLHGAIAETNATRTLFVTAKPQNSSLLRPNDDLLGQYLTRGAFEVVETVDVQTQTLWECLEAAEATRVDLIKLDTQGTELEILKGARVDRLRPLAVMVEIQFQPYYRGAPPASEVLAFMSSLGFGLYDLRTSRWVRSASRRSPGFATGEIIWGDALFINEANQQSGEQLVAQIALLVALGQPYTARALCSEAPAELRSRLEELIDDHILHELRLGSILRKVRARTPRFRSRH
jgi:FkbM family methyltransferase